VGVRCNIVDLALARQKAFKWGFGNTHTIDILENYKQYLNCDDAPPDPCFTEDCNQEAIIFNCNVNILKASLDTVEDVLTFTFEVGDIVGGKAPFTYLWEYDTTHFFVQGPVNQEQLVLILKPGFDLDILVSELSLTITDADGCRDTKHMWIVNGELIYWNYVACPNPHSLVVTNKFTYCPAPSNLIVQPI